jgi:hypothetical protein
MTAPGRADEPTVNPRRRARASWVRCICGGCSPPGRGRHAGLRRGSRPGGRRRGRTGLEPVCLWCARGGRGPALPAQPGHTQPKSGADRRCQGRPVRAERSEPRSGGLDCRRAVELAVALVMRGDWEPGAHRGPELRCGRGHGQAARDAQQLESGERGGVRCCDHGLRVRGRRIARGAVWVRVPRTRSLPARALGRAHVGRRSVGRAQSDRAVRAGGFCPCPTVWMRAEGCDRGWRGTRSDCRLALRQGRHRDFRGDDRGGAAGIAARVIAAPAAG